MIYALSIWKDNSIEVFNIKNSTLEDIIEDINCYGGRSIVNNTDKEVLVRSDVLDTTYFYSKEDRTQKAIQALNV